MSITVIIIIITAIVSISGFYNQKVIDNFVFNAAEVSHQNQWYRFFTCGLIHADFFHLLFNMFSFYSFGQYVVEPNFHYLFGSLGPMLYLILYIVSQFLCLLPTYFKNKDNYYYNSLGASGAVSAIIFAGILLSPLTKLGIMFIPIPIPGFIFGFIYLAITAYLGKKGTGGVNHSAHLFGAISGMMLLIIFGYLFSPYDLVKNFIVEIKSFGG